MVYYSRCSCGLGYWYSVRHSNAHSDLESLELLRFEKVVGIFLLTERGHGLDAFNIETTATRLSDGSYILNTPREEATKFMPASTPAFGNQMLRWSWQGSWIKANISDVETS
ncbi:uncharacterized protein EV420DRAFT_1479333 [Desarmillaria tabescens]|uniref:Acyl-CoA oxidase/dehydrogenase middle domain-containing protein n=1 Tax=Armillaria tabescens TaxID=1929756 RepID=A0AA39N6M2_ARMTA|nr:uncharacterized protein EV420DRAFT_1479333 [Desarmillaria tabescens]KAK0459349.1 hypothetical protein EV420DRAFT_1479333 [Desarmillaria tabescens]